MVRDSNSNAMTGSRQSHYSTPAEGPFRCDHCSHFHHERATCDHPNVLADAKNGEEELKMVGDMPQVAPAGCCAYYRKRS